MQTRQVFLEVFCEKDRNLFAQRTDFVKKAFTYSGNPPLLLGRQSYVPRQTDAHHGALAWGAFHSHDAARLAHEALPLRQAPPRARPAWL